MTIGRIFENFQHYFWHQFTMVFEKPSGRYHTLLTVVEALVCPLKIRFRVTVGSFVGHC